MKKKIVIGVVAGFAVWASLWLLGNRLLGGDIAAVVERGGHFDEVGPLLLVLVLSMVCSLAAGFTTAKLTGILYTASERILAICLIAVGIAVQGSVWSNMPLWYHLSFLVLIFPVALAGGRLARR